MTSGDNRDALEPLLALRQHQQGGVRSPHKPLLLLLALGQLHNSGTSLMPWSACESKLALLIEEFGPPSKTGARQAAAYPFTRLRSDLIWTLNVDVPMDRVTPLDEGDVVGQLADEIESVLRAEPHLLFETARQLVEAEFPPTVAPDVLLAAGLDPESVYGFPTTATRQRRRNASWPGKILTAWDRQCAFCGFDGQLGSGSVGLEAAHIRWFNFDGPDEMDNGLALCALHHKLFDRGVLGLSGEYRIQVSDAYTARTDAGRVVYDLLDKPLRPRPGTQVPALDHISWHHAQVFKGTVAS